MFYAVIDTESLHDPRLINDFDQLRVMVEHEPNSEASKYHHVFFLKLSQDDEGNFSNKVIKNMKQGWFAFLWNEDFLRVYFRDRHFDFKFLDWPNEKYQEMIEYARGLNIQEEFLGIKEYFERYNNLVNEYYLSD